MGTLSQFKFIPKSRDLYRAGAGVQVQVPTYTQLSSLDIDRTLSMSFKEILKRTCNLSRWYKHILQNSTYAHESID